MIEAFCTRHTFLTVIIEIQSTTIHTDTTEILCTHILSILTDPISDLHSSSFHFNQQYLS